MTEHLVMCLLSILIYSFSCWNHLLHFLNWVMYLIYLQTILCIFWKHTSTFIRYILWIFSPNLWLAISLEEQFLILTKYICFSSFNCFIFFVFLSKKFIVTYLLVTKISSTGNPFFNEIIVTTPESLLYWINLIIRVTPVRLIIIST